MIKPKTRPRPRIPKSVDLFHRFLLLLLLRLRLLILLLLFLTFDLSLDWLSLWYTCRLTHDALHAQKPTHINILFTHKRITKETHLMLVARHLGRNELRKVVLLQRRQNASMQRIVVRNDVAHIYAHQTKQSTVSQSLLQPDRISPTEMTTQILAVEDIVDFARRRLQQELRGCLDPFFCVHSGIRRGYAKVQKVVGRE